MRKSTLFISTALTMFSAPALARQAVRALLSTKKHR